MPTNTEAQPRSNRRKDKAPHAPNLEQSAPALAWIAATCNLVASGPRGSAGYLSEDRALSLLGIVSEMSGQLGRTEPATAPPTALPAPVVEPEPRQHEPDALKESPAPVAEPEPEPQGFRLCLGGDPQWFDYAAVGALLCAWRAALPNPVLASELRGFLCAVEDGEMDSPPFRELRAAAIAVFKPDPKAWSVPHIGHILRKIKGKPLDGVCVKNVPNRRDASYWWVDVAAPTDQDH